MGIAVVPSSSIHNSTGSDKLQTKPFASERRRSVLMFAVLYSERSHSARLGLAPEHIHWHAVFPTVYVATRTRLLSTIRLSLLDGHPYALSRFFYHAHAKTMARCQ
jgi:hypothetical protein